MRNKIMLLFLVVLMFNLVACGNKDTATQSESTNQPETEITQETSEEPLDEENEETAADQEEQPEETDASDTEVDPELKAFLDEYEKFMDEYIDFMKKYDGSDNSVELISDYTSIMQQYAEFAETIEKYDSEEMSGADAAYYLEVVNRVNEKMLKSLGSLD